MSKFRRQRRDITQEAERAIEALAEERAPRAQREAVLDRHGLVVREAIAEASSWRDPDDLNPNARSPRLVAGYRRVDELRRLYVSGGVTEKQFKAAQQLLTDCELAGGARPGSQPASVRVDAASQFGPGQVQLDAARRFREAMQVLGQFASAVLMYALLENAKVSEVARNFNVQHYQALGWLQGALERLVEHYDGS